MQAVFDRFISLILCICLLVKINWVSNGFGNKHTNLKSLGRGLNSYKSVPCESKHGMQNKKKQGV